MIELNLNEVKKDLISFKQYHTYVFIQTWSQIYNGYVYEIGDNDFLFQDDSIPTPFPIRFDSLKAPIVPSKKIPTKSWRGQ